MRDDSTDNISDKKLVVGCGPGNCACHVDHSGWDTLDCDKVVKAKFQVDFFDLLNLATDAHNQYKHILLEAVPLPSGDPNNARILSSIFYYLKQEGGVVYFSAASSIANSLKKHSAQLAINNFSGYFFYFCNGSQFVMCSENIALKDLISTSFDEKQNPIKISQIFNDAIRRMEIRSSEFIHKTILSAAVSLDIYLAERTTRQWVRNTFRTDPFIQEHNALVSMLKQYDRGEINSTLLFKKISELKINFPSTKKPSQELDFDHNKLSNVLSFCENLIHLTDIKMTYALCGTQNLSNTPHI